MNQCRVTVKLSVESVVRTAVWNLIKKFDSFVATLSCWCRANCFYLVRHGNKTMYELGLGLGNCLYKRYIALPVGLSVAM